jgi:tRNA dimethylallyltransferase
MIEYSNPIIVIAGPTASGKSGIAIDLAKEIDGVIINADSRQIYKEISIGTAKPSKEEISEIPHFLYDHISVKDNYNIYRYQKDVSNFLKTLPKNKIPILVGGTGLYIDSVIFNYKLTENDSRDMDSGGKENGGRRREELNTLSVKELKSLVGKKTLEKLNESDRNNPVRLVRIIEKGEISEEKGKTLNHKYFVIDIEKEKLEDRIIKRVETMFENELLEENIMIREKGLDKYPALKTIGYQEFDNYFRKKKNLEEVKLDIIRNTSRYAKRQRTWFRRHEHAIWTNDYTLVLDKSLRLIKNS